MSKFRTVVAIFFALHALAANSQVSAEITLLRAIGSLKNLNEPSGRLEAINSIGIPFLLVEGFDSRIFRQAGEGSLIKTINFKGGPNAEYDVSFSKEICISMSDLKTAYGVQPQREMLPMHVLDMKSGFLRGVPVWVIYFPKTENKEQRATAWLSDDERCVGGLTFSSKSFFK